MKNSTKNIAAYSGVVTLSKYVGKKKIKITQQHNTGGTVLFDFISDCLAYNFEKANIKKPAKIMLLTETDGSYSAASTFVSLLTSPPRAVTTNKSSVKYSFIVPKDQIEVLTDFENLYVGLYPSYTKDKLDELENYVALCKLNINKKDVVNTALVVDWDLIIENYTATVD